MVTRLAAAMLLVGACKRGPSCGDLAQDARAKIERARATVSRSTDRDPTARATRLAALAAWSDALAGGAKADPGTPDPDEPADLSIARAAMAKVAGCHE